MDSALEGKLQRFEASKAKVVALIDSPEKWGNQCEDVFSEFRRAVVHLKTGEHLGNVSDKDKVVKFMCKVCKDRPSFSNRSKEALAILLTDEEFRKAFAKAVPDEIDALPEEIKNEITNPSVKPAKPDAPEAKNPEEDNPSDRRDVPVIGDVHAPLIERMGAVVVVQSCSSARLFVDAGWKEVQHGLVICVTFAGGADVALVAKIARALLRAPLCLEAEAAASVVELGRRGCLQGILVVPQESLICQLDETAELRYPGHGGREDNRGLLYQKFVEALKSTAGELITGKGSVAPQIISGAYEQPQKWEVKSDGPVHSFFF